MNSYERVMTALSGGKPDEVPYGEMFIDPKVIDKIKPGIEYVDFEEYIPPDTEVDPIL
jgi:hypothetical protein